MCLSFSLQMRLVNHQVQDAAHGHGFLTVVLLMLLDDFVIQRTPHIAVD